VLRQTKAIEYHALADSWETWLNYTKLNAPRVSHHTHSSHSTDMSQIFYNGTGHICSVVDLNQTVSPTSPSQNYTCEPGDTGTLNDPYEGELFTWWLYFYGNLSRCDRNALWTYKRPQLQAINYTGSIVNTSFSYSLPTNYSELPVISRQVGPITVQKAFWFSSHEQWKLLEMPYLDVPIVKRVFHNAERVRTCNSVIMGQNSGMFASVNNITDAATDEILGYISNVGVPSVSTQQEQELDIITPYSVFPTVLFNRSIGLQWYKNMLDGNGMQNPYGSTESGRRDGDGVSAFVSWDSKVTTLVALLGGVGDFVREGLKKEGRYGEFKYVLQREYGRVFGKHLAGEDVELCLPDFQTPVGSAVDFEMCASSE
jgi:hypothetical protein